MQITPSLGCEDGRKTGISLGAISGEDFCLCLEHPPCVGGVLFVS